MPANACCQTCWAWSELDARTTCRRCGGPLILADGRRVDEAIGAFPPPPPAPGSFGMATAAAAPAGFPTGPVLPYQLTRGTDWVAVARWITIGCGVLSMAVLIGFGLLVRHVQVPVIDARTGITVVRTFDIGAVFAIAAIVVGLIYALFAWLTQYTAARVIFLLLDALAVLGAVTQLGANVRTGTLGSLTLISLGIDLVYGAALLMSLISRPERVDVR